MKGVFTVRRVFFALAALGAIAVGVAMMSGSQPAQSAAADGADDPLAAVVEASRGDLVATITLSAELKPFEEADIHAKVAGYLQTINYDIGDRVKKGAVIATLETTELQDDLNRTKAAYELAELDYRRLLDVTKAKPGLVAQSDVDKAHAEYDIAKANYEHAKTWFDYSTISAPFDGIVTQRFADPGAMIQASISSSTQSVPIIHLADDSVLRLRFPVPESSVAQVRDGTECNVEVPAAGRTVRATVTRKAERVDSSTRTMMTECDIANPDHKLIAGMYASATLTLERKQNVLTLPIQAVSQDEKPTVWLVNADGRIEERPVEIGLRTARKVEILSGLKLGDTVIFGSRNAFAIGMKVRPKMTPSAERDAGTDKG